MAKANVPVEFSPVDSRKVEAAIARIQSQAKGVSFGGGAESINKLSRPLGKITGQASEFQKSLEASNARVLAFGASVAVINKLSQAFGALVSNTVKVEASFAKINTILGGTKKEIEEFGNGIFKVAQRTATSFDQVAEGALELARQGLGVAESLARVETALKLVRVAGIDSQQAVAGLTAAIKGFEGAGLTVAAIGDKLAEVDTKFAVSTEDLINGLERASASARVAGVSFDELLAAVTTVQERTQRGGAVIGNAFKTIFARLGRTDTLKTLQDLGISVLDTEGNVRSAIPLFQELAGELNKLGLKSVEAGEVIQKVAGVRQRDILISLVEDLNSSQSQFAKSLEVSAGAAGALDSKNQKLNQTLEALINNLTVGGEKLASVLGEIGFTDQAKDLLKLFGDIVNSITDVLQGDTIGSKFAKGLIKGIGATLTPGIALVGAIFIKLFVDLAKFGASSLKQILGINKASQLQNSLQQSVLQTLLQNESIQREILALEGNKVAQEQLLLKIYTQQAAALARVQKAAAVVTPGLFKGGMRGGESGVTKRGAGGYVSAESRDVSRGVGGAPASSKVVSIPNFAFGGGQRGTMVANTSEYYVPNYKGGGDAIFNKDMVRSMGLPGGAKKLNAAGGFIPNFASKGTPDYFRNISRKANPTSAEKKELAAYQASRGGTPFNAEQKGIVMLVPQTNVRGADLATRFKKPKLGKKGTYNSFIGKAFGIDPNLKSDSKFGSLVGLDDELESAMAHSINSIIGKVYPSIKTSPTPPITSKAAKEKFLQEGGAGAFGSFRGAMFEAIIEMIVGGSNRDGAGTLDVAFNSGNTAALEEIFGLPKKYKVGDYKNSVLSKGKFIDQAISNRGAGGYIPNFFGGALEEAISRENQAGVPLNQIRVNQSGKLRNAKNPKGLAVTNTRDEPTGAIPNFNKGGMGDGMGGGIGGIFVVQAISGMASSFVDAESAMGKLLTVVTTLTTALFSFQLITPALKTFQTRLSDTASSLKRTTSTFDRSTRRFRNASGQFVSNASGRSLGNRMGGIKGGLATGGAAAAGFLAGPGGIALGLGAATLALTKSMTATKDGLKGMAAAIDSIDFSKLTPEGMQGFAETLTRQAVKSVDNASKNSNSNLIVNPGEDLIQAFLRDAKSGDDSTRFGDESALRTGLGLSTRRFLFGGLTVGAADEPTQKRFAAQALAFDQLNAEGKIDETFEEFLAQFERKILGTIDAVRFDKAITELFAEVGRELPKTTEELEKERAGASKTLSILDFDSTTIKNAQRAGAASRFKGLSIAEGVPNFVREFGGTNKTSQNIVKQQKMAIKLAGDLGRLERERLVANKAILDSQMAQTEAARKLGSELGGAVLKSLDTKTANTAMAKAIETAVKEGKSFEEVLGRINILREEGEISDEAEKELQRITDSYIDQNNQLEIQNKLTQDILDKRKEMADMSPLDSANEKRKNDLKELSEDVPKRLADNLENSIANAMDNLADGTYDSLGDVFLNIALDFGKALQQEISAAVAKNLVQSFTSSGVGKGLMQGAGNIVQSVGGYNSGGMVTGGGGVIDDVPAKLTSGEYVIKKSAVQKYGVDFLDRLNSGGIQGLQNGGSLITQGADNTRTGKFWSDPRGYSEGGARSRAYLEEAKKRDFFVPGQRGFGSIVGKENLLAFSQQGVTSGSTDIISSRAGGASINLEDQSARLTAFGRRRDSPAKRALEEAQGQAFDLYQRSVAEEQRVVQENKDAKKARKDALKQAVIGAFVNATMAGVSAGISNVSKGGSFFGAAPTQNLNLTSDFMSSSGEFFKEGTSMMNIDGMTEKFKTGSIFGIDQFGIRPTSAGLDALKGGSMFNSGVQNVMQVGNQFMNTADYYTQYPSNMNRAANGGLMSGGGSNSANALLMDGEYVMGSDASSSLGKETLDSINTMNFANGGPVGASTASGGEKADVGTLNIEINIEKDGEASTSTSGSGEQDPEKAKEFTKKVKDVVLNVINEEKRVSGSLFTRNK
jgi:TP901 family phage tail tape measure protein